jgi:hypothetical protein
MAFFDLLHQSVSSVINPDSKNGSSGSCVLLSRYLQTNAFGHLKALKIIDRNIFLSVIIKYMSPELPKTNHKIQQQQR